MLRFLLLAITVALFILNVDLKEYGADYFDPNITRYPSAQNTFLALYSATIGILIFFYFVGIVTRFYQFLKAILNSGGNSNIQV